jgi:hypothetical protein
MRTASLLSLCEPLLIVAMLCCYLGLEMPALGGAYTAVEFGVYKHVEEVAGVRVHLHGVNAVDY